MNEYRKIFQIFKKQFLIENVIVFFFFTKKKEIHKHFYKIYYTNLIFFK